MADSEIRGSQGVLVERLKDRAKSPKPSQERLGTVGDSKRHVEHPLFGLLGSGQYQSCWFPISLPRVGVTLRMGFLLPRLIGIIQNGEPGKRWLVSSQTSLHACFFGDRDFAVLDVARCIRHCNH